VQTGADLTELKLARAVFQLRAEITFKKIKELLEPLEIQVLVLKGPHLGSTVYDSPQQRLYGDLDILVRPDEFDRAAALLRENGFEPFAFDEFAPEIQRDFKHWEYRSPQGVIVELHRWLSGHDRFDVDSGGLFERAEPFTFGETPAKGLGKEDLLLHLCLHMGTSYFLAIERKHIQDIALLVGKREVDWIVFMKRAQGAGAAAVVHYALLATRLQEGAEIPARVLGELRPCFFRRLWLDAHIDPGSYPIYRFPLHSMKRIKRRLLLPLLDRPGQWLAFIARMTGNKLRALGRRH